MKKILLIIIASFCLSAYSQTDVLVDPINSAIETAVYLRADHYLSDRVSLEVGTAISDRHFNWSVTPKYYFQTKKKVKPYVGFYTRDVNNGAFFFPTGTDVGPMMGVKSNTERFTVDFGLGGGMLVSRDARSESGIFTPSHPARGEFRVLVKFAFGYRIGTGVRKAKRNAE